MNKRRERACISVGKIEDWRKYKYHTPDEEDIKIMHDLIRIKSNNIILCLLILYLILTLFSWWEYNYLPNVFNFLNYFQFQNGIEFISMIALNIMFIYIYYDKYNFFKSFKSEKCSIKYSTLIRYEYKYVDFKKKFIIIVNGLNGNELEYELNKFSYPRNKQGLGVMIVRIDKKEIAFILRKKQLKQIRLD